MVTLLNTIDTTHGDLIHDAQLDYYGNRLATCSSDNKIKIFDVKNNSSNVIAELNGHNGPVWQCSWSHPMMGTMIASCGFDKKLIIWKEDSVGQWNIVFEYDQFQSSVNSVCWAPYELGAIVAAGSSDGTIGILSQGSNGTWDMKRIEAHKLGCNCVSWAPALAAGSLLESHTSDSQLDKPKMVKMLVSGGSEQQVKLWREEDGGNWVEDQVLTGHSDWVRDVAWAPSPGLNKSVIASCSQDGRVIIWSKDAVSGSDWTQREICKFDDAIWHVSWSLQGTVLAVSGGDNKVTLWSESPEGQWVNLSSVTDDHDSSKQHADYSHEASENSSNLVTNGTI